MRVGDLVKTTINRTHFPADTLGLIISKDAVTGSRCRPPLILCDVFMFSADCTRKFLANNLEVLEVVSS